ncbi:MAG TPA: serine hydrolase domain-containing protein [Acidobacteriota bacterium]|nr:serine hydrolase domain-containing protein [Acidobacteriota bacterium]
MKLLCILLLLIPLNPIHAAPATIDPKAIETVDAYLKNAVKHDYSGSVLVASHGKVLLSSGYGLADRTHGIPFRAGTVFDIGSLTKQFTAAAILKLQIQKKLSVQDAISKYLEGVPEDKKSITIDQLLTHTAGFTDALGEDEEWIGREDYLKLAFHSELQSPGKFSYSNVGYSILAAIVEKVSGQEYEHFLREYLFLPAGMKLTGYVLPQWKREDMAIGYRNGEEWGTTFDKSRYQNGVTWHLKGNGGIHSTLEDMYRWYVALQGHAILSDEAKRAYFAPHVEDAPNVHYAYGWSVRQNSRGETVITHNGGNGYFMATVYMIPAQDFVIIASSNNNPKNTDTIAARMDRMLFERLPPLDEKFIATFSGDYDLPDGGTIHVTFDENDAAQASMNDTQSWRLLSAGKDDDLQVAAGYDQKIRAMWLALKSGDIPKAAAALPSTGPEKATQEFLGAMRDRMSKRKGEIRLVYVLGSVSRRGGSYYLTAVKITCERGDLYQVYVWKDGRIQEVRPAEEANLKAFDHESGGTFYAEGNDLRITFRVDKDRPAAIIGDVTAYKHEDHEEK